MGERKLEDNSFLALLLPAIVIASFLVQEVATVYGSILSGELNVGHYFQQF